MRNRSKYLEELKQKNKDKFDLLVLEACLVENDLSPWIVDSGMTNHVCSSVQILSYFRELAVGDPTMRMGTGALVLGKAVREVRLQFSNCWSVRLTERGGESVFRTLKTF